MSKYFTKYLPVEGEGDTNCKWQWYNNVQNTGWEDITPSNMDAIIAHGLNPVPKFRKLKLFLCSRDIQVGDELTSIKGNLKGRVEDEVQLRDLEKNGVWFKVIGEISPDALSYVKEGQEFDEENIKNTNIRLFSWEPYIYKIKGPCGHFH